MAKLLNVARNSYTSCQTSMIRRLLCGHHVVVTGAQRRCVSAVSSKTSTSLTDSELTLTDSCAQQIKRISEPGSFLRVFVDSGGCSGFQYKFEIDSTVQDDDRVFERDSARVVIDNESLKMIRGSVIDYHEELIRSAFRVVSNPQMEHGCSCGASFTVKL